MSNYEKWLQKIEKELGKKAFRVEISEGFYSNPFIDKKEHLCIPTPEKDIGWIHFEEIQKREELDIVLKNGAKGISLPSSLIHNLDTSNIQALRLLDINNESVFNLIKNHPHIKFIIPYSISNQCIYSISHNIYAELQLNQDLEDLLIQARNISLQKPIPFVFTLNSSNNFYFNLAKIKALKHLWGILAKAHEFENSKILIFIKIQSSIQDHNLQLVENTLKAISSLIGNADCIEFPYTEDIEKKERQSHIHNILYHESHFYQVDDSSLGSFFMDDIVKEIIEKTWLKFLDKNEKNSCS